MSKVIVIASFKPKDGQAQAVSDLLTSVMVGPTREEAGNERYDLYRDKDGDGFHLFEVYTDTVALDAHRAAEYYKTYRAQILDLLAEPIAVKVLVGVDVAGA